MQIDERILRSSEYKQYRNVGKALVISNVKYRQKGARSDRKDKDASGLINICSRFCCFLHNYTYTSYRKIETEGYGGNVR